MDAPQVLQPFHEGEDISKQVNHGRPTTLVVVSSWKTKVAMVDATVSSRRRLLSKTKDSLLDAAVARCI